MCLTIHKKLFIHDMNVPSRPGVVIRAPERERNKERRESRDMRDDPKNKNLEMLSTPVSLRQPTTGTCSGKNTNTGANKEMGVGFTVYTNVRKCQFSLDLLDMLQKKGLAFEHIDVSKMSAIPGWLKGTPVIIHDGKGYCGDSAFEFVGCISEDMAKEAEDAQQEVAHNTHDDNAGCGIAQAFAPPNDVLDDEKYSTSTEDLMQRAMAGRK